MRDIPVGNGCLLVNFDDKYQIRDVYFPHVGQENHTEGFPFRFGVWVDGEFSWIASNDWHRSLEYLPETLVTHVTLVNERLQLLLTCSDTVASHDNIYLRRITVKNTAATRREIRLFLHHDFRIYENKVGDTAFYDPETSSLIHYKKHRYFLINTQPSFDAFATGRKAFRQNEGTWRDAEDGELHGGAITEGSVDSTIAVHASLDGGESSEKYYWIAAGTTHNEVAELNRHIIERGPGVFLQYTSNYWKAWVNKNRTDFDGLPREIADLYKRSLLIINTQVDDGGAILAANDHDVTERATDHYSYLWTRDGAFVANALDGAGYSEMARGFYSLCCNIIHERGYFLQKYNPDGTVASGWHASWDALAKEPLLPIQEDETSLVLWALWQHYDKYRDIDFAHRCYRRLIVKAANFLADYRDERTGLPRPSWNLWENSRGVHTFTCSTVVAGLRAAANFARLFDENSRAHNYETAADDIVAAMRDRLYSREHRRFFRSLLVAGDGSALPDATVDASLFGVFYFGCFPADDEVVTGTMSAIEQTLVNGGKIGGVARFENDGYMRVAPDATGNSWIITTLWLAEYIIASANNTAELQKAVEIFKWVASRALPSGVLPEQVDPRSGDPLSVSPLTWSHSSFVAAVHSYLEKRNSFLS